jgi:hypothetical protein
MPKDLDGSLGPNTEWSVEILENGEPLRRIRIVTKRKEGSRWLQLASLGWIGKQKPARVSGELCGILGDEV